MNWKQASGTTAGLILGLLLTTPGSGQAATPVPLGSDATEAFLLSAEPKTVVVDPATGAVISVTAGETEPDDLSGIQPLISSDTSCAASDGCYETPVINSTYHDRSFYGSAGTFTGSWPRRNAWDSGSYTASVCWESACSGKYGPNTHQTFSGGALVTGTSFTIY
jgi:hypothetical protein